MLQEPPPGPPPPRRYARLRELAKFALIANAVACGLFFLPLTLAAAYHVERTGRLAAGPLVWRVLGIPDAGMIGSLLIGAATPPLLIARRRKAMARAGVAVAAATVVPTRTPGTATREQVIRDAAKW